MSDTRTLGILFYFILDFISSFWFLNSFSFLFLFLASSDILHYTVPPLSYTQAFHRYSRMSIPSRMGTCGYASGSAGSLRLQVGFHVYTYHSIHQYHHLFSSTYPQYSKSVYHQPHNSYGSALSHSLSHNIINACSWLITNKVYIHSHNREDAYVNDRPLCNE